MPSDMHVVATQPLVSPNELARRIPMTTKIEDHVSQSRKTIGRIWARQDPRLLCLIGPCSIHDTTMAYEFACKLENLASELADRLFIVMRTFFEKPRSSRGWPGLICDPHLNASFDGELGLEIARKLLVDINKLGLPTATEVIDPIVPQYIAELLSLATVGARTSESSTQRRLASGLSMPVGFKNGTDGSLDGAINAIVASSHPQSFFGIDHEGKSAVIHTTGNPAGMLILRGGRGMTNFDPGSIEEAAAKLRKVPLIDRVMIDVNHAQSGGDHRVEEEVWRAVAHDLPHTHQNVLGIAAECFLQGGKQAYNWPKGNPQRLVQGMSITDACMSWEATENTLRYTHKKMGECI